MVFAAILDPSVKDEPFIEDYIREDKTTKAILLKKTFISMNVDFVEEQTNLNVCNEGPKNLFQISRLKSILVTLNQKQPSKTKILNIRKLFSVLQLALVFAGTSR